MSIKKKQNSSNFRQAVFELFGIGKYNEHPLKEVCVVSEKTCISDAEYSKKSEEKVKMRRKKKHNRRNWD